MQCLEQYRLDCDNLIRNVGINSEIIREIENELKQSPGDVISLVFLLYNNTELALQRIAEYQLPSRIVYQDYRPPSGPLLEWFHSNNPTTTWKQELIECLLICQLYNIVRKLGFHVPTLKKYFQSDNLQLSIYVDPMKKVLYRLCEQMNSDNVIRLKKSLLTYDIKTTTDTCELIFLHLMRENFIKMNEYNYDKTNLGCGYQMENLARIIEKLPGLHIYASTLRSIQYKMEANLDNLVVTSTPKPEPSKVDVSTQKTQNEDSMSEVFELLNKLSIEDPIKLKTDTV